METNMEKKNGSQFLTDKFLKDIWPAYRVTLTTERARNDYFTNICQICAYAKTDFMNLTRKQAQEYFNSLSLTSRPLSKKTIYGKLSSMRSLSNFILKHSLQFSCPEHYENIFLYVDISDYEVRINADYLPTLKELDQLLCACNHDLKMFLMFSIVIRCGLTGSEVCKLKVEDMVKDNKEQSYFSIKKPKQKGRYVKIPEDITALLKEYLSGHTEKQGYLFRNRNGNVMTLRNIDALIAKYIKEAGISKHFTLQDIRNASIVLMLKAGADDSSIADYMGFTDKWMFRYQDAAEQYPVSPVDMVHIKIVH